MGDSRPRFLVGDCMFPPGQHYVWDGYMRRCVKLPSGSKYSYDQSLCERHAARLNTRHQRALKVLRALDEEA